MICIAEAGGTPNTEVIRQLTFNKIAFRGTYFSEKKAEAARVRGVETVTIDYTKPGTLLSRGSCELYRRGH